MTRQRDRRSRRLRAGLLLLTACVVHAAGATDVQAQPAASEQHVHPPAAAPADADGGGSPWQWTLDGQAFVGFNYQRREFLDFDAWESQNWIMATGRRPLGAATLRLSSMFSFEPFTVDDIGSPQVFQTGETFQGAPLIDYQHPHDLFMGLGGELVRQEGPVTLVVGADLIGAPTLGPAAFMHRPSAAENPQAPLSHHYLDSTHITAGVLRAGIGHGVWRIEGSVFHGREPDEDRVDIDLGRLDSAAVRLAWTRGAWAAQLSGGWLTQPERITPYDAKKVTASLAYTGTGERRLAWLLAFGQNREIHGNLEAYLLEASWGVSARDTLYARAESVAKDILDVGFHPVGVFHRHRQSQVGAVTVGYTRDVFRAGRQAVGLGADVTGYRVPDNLREAYGSPASFHVFLRLRGGIGTTAGHVH